MNLEIQPEKLWKKSLRLTRLPVCAVVTVDYNDRAIFSALISSNNLPKECPQRELVSETRCLPSGRTFKLTE